MRFVAGIEMTASGGEISRTAIAKVVDMKTVFARS